MKSDLTKLIFKKVRFLIIAWLIWTPVCSFAQAKIEPVAKTEKPQVVAKEHSASERNIHSKLNIDFRPKVSIELYDTETEILPTRNNSIEVILSYIAEGASDSDIEKLHKAIEQNLIKQSDEAIDLSLKFYESYISTVVTPLRSRTVIELKSGEKIKLSKFQITELKVYLPSDLDLAINAKYCTVNQKFSIKGNLDIDGYDMNLEAKSVSGNLNVKAKYSKLKLHSANNVQLNLYESKVKAKEFNIVNCISKYSKLDVGKITELQLTGYEDKLKINELVNCKIKGRYCEIELANADLLNVELYEGSLKVQNNNETVMKAKYLESEFGKVNIMRITEAYELELKAADINELYSENGKYNEFKLDNLGLIVELAGYEDDIEIGHVNANFKKIGVNAKYANVNLTLPKQIPYRLWGNVQYFSFNKSKDDFKVVLHDKESSRLKFDYHKGENSKGKEIKLEGYEVDLEISYSE